MKSASIETATIGVVLLINILTEKLNFGVKKTYGVKYHRIGENSLPNWIFRTIKIQACMQNFRKNVFFWIIFEEFTFRLRLRWN